VRKLVMQPYPFTPASFAERVRGVSAEVSARLFARWREVGLLDEHGFSDASNAQALGCGARMRRGAGSRACAGSRAWACRSDAGALGRGRVQCGADALPKQPACRHG